MQMRDNVCCFVPYVIDGVAMCDSWFLVPAHGMNKLELESYRRHGGLPQLTEKLGVQ